MKKENDILEKTLDIAESGYDNAYLFLLDAYNKDPENYGPQTLYFLSCLAGGFLSGKEFRERRLFWGILTGVLYAVILLTVSQLTTGPGSSGILKIVVIFGICMAGGAAGSIFS